MKRRRTRRCSAVTALASRGTCLLQAWLWLIVFIFQNEFLKSESIQPGYLDFDNLPDTNFTCVGKVIGGYYADVEASCQMFHVCTVGQGDEPMDIKFLCLNGTVFDQETRVCERVEEVDCSKSEKFYSLNLELYGSTIAPIIEPEDSSSDERSQDKKKESTSAQSDPTPQSNNQAEPHTQHVEPVEEHIEEDEEQQEEEEQDYEDYTREPTSTTSTSPPTTTRPLTTTTTTTTKLPISTAAPTYGSPSDSTFLSPHEFTFQHRPAPAPPSQPVPALSFQRQSYPQHAQPPRLTLTSHRGSSTQPPTPSPPPRPADHVYITAAPPQPHHYTELEQIDHYELYESSKNAPHRPAPARFLPPRTPQGFRLPAATASPPRSQLPSPGEFDRPIQSYQPSERHEIFQDHFRPLPPQPTYDYSRFHFDRKRSHETESGASTESNETRAPPLGRSASSTPSSVVRSTTSETATERSSPRFAPKSPPRVIVTASASVSDSNGKKLNYTVGNVVSAVKPIVPINYDDYKESDLIFDPFFLDVPKLKRRRKTTGKRSAAVITVPKRATTPPQSPPDRGSITTLFVPPDYVDDNYEPQSYVDTPPPEVPQDDEKEKDNKKELKNPSSQVAAASDHPQSGTERRQHWKLGVDMEKLLSALPPPGGGEFRVVHAGVASTFSCDRRPKYRAIPDSSDCRTFHVCAGRALHVQLRCVSDSHYDPVTRSCARTQRGRACDKLDHV